MAKTDPKTCSHEMSIPIQLTIQGDELINIARCPECQVLFKNRLPLYYESEWLPLIGISFFQCPTCGKHNDDNWGIAGEYGSQNDQILRIVTTCKKCQNRYVKAVSSKLWDNLLTIIEKHMELEKKEKPEPYQPSIRETKLSAPKSIPKRPVKRDKQLAQLLFTCKKCKGSQLSVQKMKVNEFSQIIISTKCPKCEKSTQIILDPLKIGDWIDPLKQGFFKCGICGSDCKIVKTEMKKKMIKVFFYCDRDWIEIQKEIPVALFPVLMTQIQKL